MSREKISIFVTIIVFILFFFSCDEDSAVAPDEEADFWDEIYQVDVELSWKPKLTVEFYEGYGDARIHVWWERI